jgi:hypothetical protein
LKSNFKKKIKTENTGEDISKVEVDSDLEKFFTDLWSFRSKKRQKL